MWRSRLMRWLFVLLVGTVSVLLLNNRKRAEDLRRARVTNKTLSRNLRELGDWSGKATARIEETESRLRAAERHLERETGRSLEHFIVQEDRAQRERARLAGKRVAIWKLEKSIGGYETLIAFQREEMDRLQREGQAAKAARKAIVIVANESKVAELRQQVAAEKRILKDSGQRPVAKLLSGEGLFGLTRAETRRYMKGWVCSESKGAPGALQFHHQGWRWQLEVYFSSREPKARAVGAWGGGDASDESKARYTDVLRLIRGTLVSLAPRTCTKRPIEVEFEIGETQ